MWNTIRLGNVKNDKIVLSTNPVYVDEEYALETEKYTIRVWISSESSLPMGSSLHYHGLIEVLEVDE